MLVTPGPAKAGGLFDFFFGAFNKPPGTAAQQSSNYGEGGADPLGPPGASAGPRTASASGPAFCVRSCDGKYFPLMRGLASPAQMCQAFCPASSTKVYFGASIDGAYSAGGERYADSENAFAYRKALRADCTCNGRDPAGLAAVDLALDPSLRAGDVVATADGLVAYSGTRGNSQQAEFTPVASYPGLTAEVRARLAEMKVAPGRADKVANAGGANAASEATGTIAQKTTVRSDKRAAVD